MDKPPDQANSSVSSKKEDHLEESEKTASPPKRRQPPKRKQPSSKHSKNNLAKFSKMQTNVTVFTSSIFTFFSLHTEFTGAPLVAGVIYDILSARDTKMTNRFTKREFQYVALLATYYRTALIVNKSKTSIIHGLGFLKESVAELLLPDVMWSYIETLGIVPLCMNIQVVPYFLDYHIMKRKSYFVDCYDFLTPEQKRDALPYWSINDEVIIKVEQGMSRALKGILELRRVKPELDGNIKFACAYDDTDFQRITPFCTEQIDVNECKLGACYRFRKNDPYSWEDNTLKLPLLHEAQPILPENYLTQSILAQLRFKSY